MNYKVKIEKKAEKFLAKMPRRDALKILQLIDVLALDPRPRWIEKLKGTKVDIYRAAWGNYRILYTIEDHILLVSISDINDRKDIYKLL